MKSYGTILLIAIWLCLPLAQNLQSSTPEIQAQHTNTDLAIDFDTQDFDTSKSNNPQKSYQKSAKDQQEVQDSLEMLQNTESSPISKPTILSFLYNAGFDFLLDNTENTQSLLWDTRTRYTLGVNGEMGLSIYDSHKIILGGYGLQDMGVKRVFNAGGGLLAYYAYDSTQTKAGKFSTTLGIFPRKKFLKTYSKSFFRSDFLFLNPASNGLLLQYTSPNAQKITGKAEVVFDWFGGNLTKRYDEFFLLFGSEVSFVNSVNVGFDGLVFHFKNSDVLGADNAQGQSDTYLLDRILYNAYAELDFRGFVPAFKKHLQKAQIGFSALGQIERKRKLSGNEPFYVGSGYEASLNVQYKGFGIKESYYFGKAQMRYFEAYKQRVYEGLPLYQTEFNQINAYYAYQNKFLRTQLSLIFYIFRGNLATQQMLIFSINTDKIAKPKRLR